MIVRATLHYGGLRPGDVVTVDPRQKRVKQLLAMGAIVPVKRPAPEEE